MERTVAIPPPLACAIEAIPREERAGHLELLRRLFPGRVIGSERLPDGYAFRFHADDLEELGRFVANERRCCPFLRIEIEVEPPTELVTMRMSGPLGTHEFLKAELSLDGGYDGEITGGR